MQLYQFDYSPYCAKIRAILNYKHLPYECVEILPILTQHVVRNISGQLSVPVLRDGDSVLVDSTDIAIYLDTAYPDRSIIPSDYRTYQGCMMWEDWSDEALGACVRAVFLEALRTRPEAAADAMPSYNNIFLDTLTPKVSPLVATLFERRYHIQRRNLPLYHRRLKRYLELLTGAVSETGFLVGDTMTLGDIAVATMTKSLDLSPDLRQDPRNELFFEWRNSILAACGILPV